MATLFDWKNFYNVKEGKERKTDWILDQIEARFDNHLNLIMIVVGETGQGKSYTALRLGEKTAQRFNVPFTIDQVVFDPTEFFGLVRKLPPRSTIMVDEGSVDASELIPYRTDNGLYVESIEQIYKKFKDRLSLIQVLSSNLKEEKWCKPSAITKHNIYNHKMYKITTETGKTISGTSNHSFVVDDDNIIKVVKGNALKVGMKVPVTKGG